MVYKMACRLCQSKHIVINELCYKHRVGICKGVVKKTGKPCTNMKKDINGFCHQHYKQSQEYELTHPYSIVIQKEKAKKFLLK